MSCDYKNLFGFTEYDGKCSFFGGQAPLPQGMGWFILIGLGAIFSLLTSFMVWVDGKYGAGKYSTSEGFSTAGRAISVGLTCNDVVSKWTWAATLLQSSNVAYKFGVSGPFWYAAGATIQVLLFSILAVEIKRKAPNVHTVLEIVKTRWGFAAHMVFLVYCLICNVIVTSMLILGGADVVFALTGVNIYAAAFLIPVGVAFYTAHGGLRATYLAAWTHTTIIYVAMCIFMFIIYGSSPDLGSPGVVYENLRAQEGKNPVKDNMGGSYLTMFSKSGLIFGIINIIGNFGTVFVDQSYWQGAIAARPSATYKGYLLGGLCWFAIPFTLATTMGLAGRALDLPITIDESNKGLTPPAVAVHLLGRGGAFLVALQLFMAVTSTGNSEQMAVASLIAYDVYREYFKPKATGKQIVFVSRIMVFVYSILSGVFAVILLRMKLSLGWVYLFMGIVIGSAVFPIACSITWKKCSAVAAVSGAVAGTPLAIMTWLVTAKSLFGEITLKTTGEDYPMLAGNLVALGSSAIITIIFSLVWPADFDWNNLRNISTIEEDGNATLDQDSKEQLDQVLSWTYKTGGTLTFVLLVLWPLLALPAKVFSKGYFTFWVAIAIIWGLMATAVCFFWPIVEGWKEIVHVLKSVLTCAPATITEPADPSVFKAEIELKADKLDAKA